MKDKFELAIYNRLRSGGEIAAELTASTPDRRRWIAVGKTKKKPFGTEHLDYIYMAVQFEMEKITYENNKRNDYYQEEHLDKKFYYLNSDEELLQLLETLKVDPKSFTYPWKCDYP
ncbi:hypothetical protein [Chitinophaga sp. CF418]|uniref:hypothetical protein n=1 Tax=Chitinophaga sp. CF418 TaxID=1855287 RepID=UPI00090EC206|nr:hypothetical protein [Chitinophaga sp. CF418]SHN35717.1 hypothetical protein SAMN05216311_1108 [Chitinophaga sp. CF418]